MADDTPANNTSRPFVYPIKSLFKSEIVPAADETATDEAAGQAPPTIGMASTRRKGSKRSHNEAGSSDTVKSPPSASKHRRKSSNLDAATSPRAAQNFRHFPGEDDMFEASSSVAESESFSSSHMGSPSSNAGLELSPAGQYVDSFSGDVFAAGNDPVHDPRHPQALTMVAQDAFSSFSDSLIPNDTWPATSTPSESSQSLSRVEEETPEESQQEDAGSNSSQPLNWSEMGFVHLPPLPDSPMGSSRGVGSSQGGSSRHRSQRSKLSAPGASRSLTSSVEPIPENTAHPEEGSLPSDSIGEFSGQGNSSGSSGMSEEMLVTVRFQHLEDKDGHHILTGREGQLLTCEDEPIRSPGAVQSFGVMIALEELDDVLLVRQVSENSGALLGLPPSYLFSLACFTDTLPESEAAVLWDTVQFLTEPESVPYSNSNHSNAGLTAKLNDTGDEEMVEQEDFEPHIFLMTGWGAPGSGKDDTNIYSPYGQSPFSSGVPSTMWPPDPTCRLWTCWCAVHRPAASPYPTLSDVEPPARRNMVILEFEFERDMINPLYPPPSPSRPPESAGSNSSGGNNSSDSGNASDKTLVSRDDITPTQTTEGASTANSLGQSSEPTPQGLETVQEEFGPLDARSGSTQLASNDLSTLADTGEEDWAPSAEDIIESTTSRSKPVPALERLRRLNRGASAGDTSASGSSTKKRFSRRAGAQAGGGPSSDTPSGPQGTGMMDVFTVISQINEQLGAANDLETFLKVVVGVIKDLTQFHRVLVYQFDEAFNGQVVSELVDWSQTHDLYRGLHFPKGDIPQQARDLYMINKVRILYDRSQTTARIVVRSKDDLDTPLNMTHCYLRAMSPIHVKYLGNMGVRASMSVSIMAFGSLWGLVACHSYGNVGMRVSFPVRKMLRLLSQSISKNIERLSYAQRLHTRKLINTIASENHPTGYIVSNADDLLGLFDADFGVLVIGEAAKILGPNEHGQEVLIMAEYLRMKQFSTVQVSQAVTSDFPDLHLSTGLEVIAGLLYVPMSSGGKDFIAFLRKGQPRKVHWAGEPKRSNGDNASLLEPRKSFKMWSEIVAGRCRQWTDEQLETAAVLSLVYGKFIEVWRQKESAMNTTNLSTLLLANARHEVRTPLNHIINYLEMALNGPLDLETRDNLNRSHTASKNLLFTINDLLDLTRLETGNETSFSDTFDLPSTITLALEAYKNEAQRRNLEFSLDVSKSPSLVIGDSKKIRSVVQNLTANALKYTSTGSIKVTCAVLEEPDGLRGPKQTAVQISVEDTGSGIEPGKLESIFREFEQVESAEPKTSSQGGVGLGLAVVARIVEQLGGQLRVESEVEKGSKFSFLIPLSLPGEEGQPSSPAPNSLSSHSSSFKSITGSKTSSEIDSLVEALSSHQFMGTSTYSNNDRSHDRQSSSSGAFNVTDSGRPIKPVRLDDYNVDSLSRPSAPVSPSRTSAPVLSRSGLEEVASPPSSSTLSPPQASKPESKPVEPEQVSLRILIVEDNEINQAVLAKRLKMQGHTVVNTNNGQEGLDMIKSDRNFDCVLMDIAMPILNGFESAAKIREYEQGEGASDIPDRKSFTLNGRVPIFAVSASLLESQHDQLFACGMDGWILKPIDFKRLREVLQGITIPSVRTSNLYYQGVSWERGGWLIDASVEKPDKEVIAAAAQKLSNTLPA